MKSAAPLDLLYSDLWTSPILSIDGFKYYVVFIDHYTKYIWLYPLKQKSHVLSTFQNFKSLVETYFNAKIKSFYSENGGEFTALATFFVQSGISHYTSPPHTPEHNGYAERRHRHIVETGLSLLSHASMPLTYWSYAFKTVVYLINRMPTPTLHLESPFSKLFATTPNYSKLRTFGCLCYPWLRPYSPHKIAPRSAPCLFVGYSTSQSAYLCLHLPTGRVYVSRHVEFVETIFPFTTHHQHLQCLDAETSAEWLPSISHLPLIRDAPTAAPIITSPPCIPTPVPSLHPSSPTPPSPQTPTLEPPPPSSPAPRQIITRSKNNIFKPIQRLTLIATLPPPADSEPHTVSQAL